MTSEWRDSLQSIRYILLDYPAVFEAGKSEDFVRFLDAVEALPIDIIVCQSFDLYDQCVGRVIRSSGQYGTHSAELLRSFAESGRMHVSDQISVFNYIERGNSDPGFCLVTGSKSSVLNKIGLSVPSVRYPLLIFSADSVSQYDDVSLYVEQYSARRANPIASSMDYLDVAIYVNVGDTVFTDKGDKIQLTEKINTGAEGLVFRTSRADLVAKIYHRGVMTPLRWQKLRHMTKMNLDADGICWPVALLYNANHEPVGYVMPRAEGYTLGSVFDGQDAILDRFPDWDRASVVKATVRVLEKIVFLHLCGILIGDIQLKNIMISDPDHVYLIDMDSVQIEDLPCPVGTEEFTPPELWDRSFQSFLRTPLDEDYSCGILSFVMIFCGQHPYNQRQGHETLREEIQAKAFPYDLRNIDNSSIPLGGYEQIWLHLTSEMRDKLFLAFAKGDRYETIEWYSYLRSYLNVLNKGALPDSESYRLFPNQIRHKQQVTAEYGKRSFRDAIIHNPSDSTQEEQERREENQKVYYNGRRIGVAFVNQDRLSGFERTQNNVGDDVLVERDAKNNSRVEKREPFKAKTDSHTNHFRQRKQKKIRPLPILLTVLAILLLATLVILYTIYVL